MRGDLGIEEEERPGQLGVTMDGLCADSQDSAAITVAVAVAVAVDALIDTGEHKVAVVIDAVRARNEGQQSVQRSSFNAESGREKRRTTCPIQLNIKA